MPPSPLELVQRFERPVHGRESDVRDAVEVVHPKVVTAHGNRPTWAKSAGGGPSDEDMDTSSFHFPSGRSIVKREPYDASLGLGWWKRRFFPDRVATSQCPVCDAVGYDGKPPVHTRSWCESYIAKVAETRAALGHEPEDLGWDAEK
jgi:hypothetical protein